MDRAGELLATGNKHIKQIYKKMVANSPLNIVLYNKQKISQPEKVS